MSSIDPSPNNKAIETQRSRRISETFTAKTRDSGDVQHGDEANNPLPRLQVDVSTTRTVNVFAYDPNADVSDTLLQKNGTLRGGYGDLPGLTALAIAETLADLKIFSISLRTTANFRFGGAPKSSETYAKNAKGAISGVIPFDQDTMTILNEHGKIVPFEQNLNDLPKLDNVDNKLVQDKPFLEDIILAMQPPNPKWEVVAISDAGELELKQVIDLSQVNPDPAQRSDSENKLIALDAQRFKINLKDPQEELPEGKIDENKALGLKPTWWKDSFGNFDAKATSGFPLTYKKTPDAAFKPFLVYGRENDQGKVVPITGDFDVMNFSRSTVYQMETLATDTIDSKTETSRLMEDIHKVHNLVSAKKMREMIDGGMPEAEAKIEIAKRSENFLAMSKFMKDTVYRMGVITPWNAYVTMQVNLRKIELTEELGRDPEAVRARIAKVKVDSSIGLAHILTHSVDTDIGTAWFNSNEAKDGIPARKQDREGSLMHVESQLRLNRFVKPEQTLIFMEDVNQKLRSQAEVRPERLKVYMNQLIQNQPDQTSSADKILRRGLIRSSRDNKFSNLMTDFHAKAVAAFKMAATDLAGVQIYIGDNKGKFQKMDFSKYLLLSIKSDFEIIIVNSGKEGQQVARIKGNSIHSNLPGEAGQKHIKDLLASVKMEQATKPNINVAKTESPKIDAKQSIRPTM